MDSCSWMLIGTSPSSNWPPMVLKINLGHLETLVRRFLSLGIVLSLQKLESPCVVAENLLKSISGQSTVEDTAVLYLSPPVPRPGLITRPAVGRNTAVFRVGHGRALPEHGRAFSPCSRLNLPNQLALGIKSTATRTQPCNDLGVPVFWLQLDEMTSECPETRA
ncbi:unnamed protein product [Linum trigynum]|uniref:Uncharacterized protein n=1 Tax=Linum trigynum TaxID=586398 RepID=A0AAV2DCV5_9ROSI